MAETKENILAQDEVIKKLQIEIQGQEVEVKAKSKVVNEAKNINTIEQEKNNRYKKANAALKAKLTFIEDNYDYSSKAKALSLSDFKDIIDSNQNVNSALQGFAEKLVSTQKEIQEIETRKSMMA